jgi:hypothetical protein
MTERVLSPCSPSVADARSVASGASQLCLLALVCAAHLCLTQPVTAQSNVPKLTASNPIGSAEQGSSVAVSADGNTAIVGGPFDNSGAGAAWVFTRSGGAWTQQQKLTADDANGAAEMGWSVALSADGNTAIVGGPGDNSSIGAAWLFTRSGSAWSQQGAKLSGAGAAGAGCAQPGVVGSAEQGYSVALSGDGNTAIVGGWADNSALGAAWVFTRSGGVWSQPGVKLCGSGATASADILQGFAVALSENGTTAIVGGPNDNDGVGAAWVFTGSDGTWTQQGSKLVGPNGVTSQQGFSVALGSAGNTALVGGPGEETPGTDTIDGQQVTVAMSKGAVWVFTRSGGAWSQQGDKLVGTSLAKSNPGQGFSVALASSGNTTLVGGPTANANTGAAWVFARSGGTWNQQGSRLVGAGAIGAASQATSVALSGDGSTAILGGSLDQEATGAAWVFAGGASPVGFSPPVSTHDFSGDGKSDTFWRDTAGDVGMWLMNGSSILQTGVLGNVPANWSAIGQRDFNGDGFADILWRDIAGDVGIWLMNGIQIISSTVIGNVPINWSVAGTGDFNGDGYGDILWRDTSGNVGVWLMKGTTIQHAAVVGNVPVGWTIVGADMSGDIFWRNTTTGEVGMWVMAGTRITTTVDFGPVPPSWTIAGVGDFDGNGSTDILWRDNLGNVGIWLMNGTQIISTAVLGNVPFNWSIAATGDYNGDGKSDILWTDNAGDVGAWLMNGGMVSSVADYGSVGLAWSVQSLNAE